ncbi:hypothetical protein [Demequina salsinemoris]|uniref:hypothetical protein n=1 Tax=Demequina salsinemoris TaxID=577470 RepID=UPI0007805961|nr:hypothetical protein [Demequina salsinemoris]
MDLMEGPRGRRLCLATMLEWAHHAQGEAGRELAEAVFFASHQLDPRRGSSATYALATFAVEGSEPAAMPTCTAADVVRAWAEAPRGHVDEHSLMSALTASIDAARYWQEADGEDALAATDEMRGPLTEVAAAIEANDACAWWSAPVDLTSQWVVEFDYPDFPAGPQPAVDPGEVLASWSEAIAEEEIGARHSLPTDPTTNHSGPWWSKPPNALTRTTRSLGADGPAGLWLIEDSHGPQRALVRRAGVPSTANVYEIDGPDAWADLCRRFPLDVTASRRHDWYRTTGEAGPWAIPDWSRVAEHYDAVHLTVAGYLETAGRAIPVGDGASSVLAGWDPDATYWFTAVRAYADTEETWVNPDDAGWSRESGEV